MKICEVAGLNIVVGYVAHYLVFNTLTGIYNRCNGKRKTQSQKLKHESDTFEKV